MPHTNGTLPNELFQWTGGYGQYLSFAQAMEITDPRSLFNRFNLRDLAKYIEVHRLYPQILFCQAQIAIPK